MGHHHHHHHHLPEDIGHYHWPFAISIGLNTIFIVIETIYAMSADSMSLLADAGHNLGDVLGLVLAWVASWLLAKPASARYSYGYKKTTILAAVFNAVVLVLTAIFIAIESIEKIMNPSLVDEWVVIVVAAIGIVVNGATAMLFFRGREHDLNIKGAYLHLASDALISLGVVISALLIWVFGIDWLDPIVGLLIVIAILFSTWGLLRDSINLLLAGVPHQIDKGKVEDYLVSLPGVSEVHDLHIWGLSTREVALTAHLVMPDAQMSDEDHSQVNTYLFQQFNISHITIQVEKGHVQDPCGQTHTC